MKKQKLMQGSCLCGSIAFDIDMDTIKAYQCHCSLCRKQSGTASNLGTIINIDKFCWSTDTSLIQTWQKSSGFTACFCKTCGSPVPSQLKAQPYMWVPVGCLDTEQVEIVAHLCVQSKASWDKLTDIKQYAALPNLPRFIQSLTSHE